jgi:two-component system chemotaxis sensor kinase CheA
MESIDELKEELTRESLEDAWEKNLEGTIEDEGEQERLLEWVRDLRDEFLDFADVVPDPEEVRDALVHRYIELKCHWQMLNTKMQYQAVNTGQPDPSLMVKGSLVSKLLEKMENLLGGDEVADLTDFLADPLEALAADRVEKGKLSEFMDFVGELIVTGEMYNHLQESLTEEDVSDEFTQNLQSTNQAFQELSSELQESLLEIREIPIDNHLQKYPVLVRKLHGGSERQASVNLEGEDTTVDRKIIEELEGPVTALVQFFAEHSIQPPDRRKQNGKEPEGSIDIAVTRSGDDVIITLETDGRPLTDQFLDELSEEENQEWPLPPETQRTDDDILSVMLALGRSVAVSPQDASGSELLSRVEKLRGTMKLTRNGADGIGIRLTVPRTQSVIVVEGLQVQAGQEEFIVPLKSVIESLPLNQAQITTIEDQGEAIQLRDKIFPMHDLADLLNLPSSGDTDEPDVAMILRESGSEYALKVDRILGQQKVVVRQLGPVFENVDYTTGSAMMGNGDICLVLDVKGLLGEINAGNF